MGGARFLALVTALACLMAPSGTVSSQSGAVPSSLRAQLGNCAVDGERVAAATVASAEAYAKSLAALGADGAESVAALALETTYLSGDRARENPALTLYARIVASVALPADTMVPAIALANSWVYSIADAETKKTILADCLLQFGSYRSTVARQEAVGARWSLARAPFAAKLLWADRVGASQWLLQEAMSLRGESALSMEVYREFVESPSAFARAAELVDGSGLIRDSVRASAEAIEAWVHARRTYRSSMENLEDFNRRGFYSQAELDAARAECAAGGYEREYMGKVRRWDGFPWFNYQIALFDRDGAFKGDCGTTTVVQMAFYRAAGIAPVSLQWINPDGIAAYTHNFPGYWHEGTGRIHSVQKPVFYGVGAKVETAAIATYFHYTKPIWHPWRWPAEFKQAKESKGRTAISYAFYPGELADQFRITSLLSIGWELDSFKRSLWSTDGYTKGKIFTDSSAPATLADTDGDGVPDALEKALSTRADSLDTDGDGRADGWELDCLFDPRKAGDVPRGLIALDGAASIGEYGLDAESPGLAYDARGDHRSTTYAYDVDYLACKVDGGFLRLAVGYARPIVGNKVETHSFAIEERGGKARRWWVQWVGRSYARAYEIPAPGEYVPIGNGDGLDAAWARDAEFSMPLSYFAEASGLSIRYYGCGFYDGKDQVADDESGFVRISLSDDDFAVRVPGLFRDISAVSDPKGDAKNVVPTSPWDIASVALAKLEVRYVIKASAWNDVSRSAFGLKTVYAREEASKRNWWLQWYSPSDVVLYTWKDGEQGAPESVDWRDFDCARFGKDLYFAFPVSIFPKGADIRWRFLTGGETRKKGELETWDDSTEPLPL
jgi:hypothetical protein